MSVEQQFPMTPAGLEKLRKELKRIKEFDRPENVQAIETALEHGDLRENAEYHAAKEEQGRLDARMRYLEFRISRAQVIDPSDFVSDKISFGATVKLMDVDNDQEVVYQIVGEDESDVNQGKISITAPIARALLGKQTADEVVVKLPKGDRVYEIVDIEYKPID